MDYEGFLKSKRSYSEPVGFDPAEPMPSFMKPHQSDVCRWALRRGKAALFLDTGLGKTAIEQVWASRVHAHAGKPVLLLTPLAVGKQMEREAIKFGIEGVRVVKPGQPLAPVTVSNYEKLHLWNPADFGGLCLDESQILKSFAGHYRTELTNFAKSIPFRLAATATPAPNDLIELTNHAEFLDILTGKEIIAQFFCQDGNTTQKWRLKGHARDPFWRWMASWSVALRKPSDIGHDDTGYVLPELRIHQTTVESKPQPGFLFPVEAKSLSERRGARRDSLSDRVQFTADIVNASPDEPWLIWCDLNAESEALVKAIPGSMQVTGSDESEVKEEKLLAFGDGRLRVMISKPTLAGYGLNYQHCSKMAFVGISDSFEQQYQAIRRCWRFGQTRPVDVYMVVSEAEGAVVENLRRKERQANEMYDEIVSHMAGLSLGRAVREETEYRPTVDMVIPEWLQQEYAA